LKIIFLATFVTLKSETDLFIEKEIYAGYENALEAVEEVRDDGPDGEGDPRAAQRIRPQMGKDICDAQQR